MKARGRPSRRAIHQRLAFEIAELRTRLGGLPSPDIDRSRLRAVKASDGTWRSSKKWVEEYRASRYQRLRQPRKGSAQDGGPL
ncbi:MAG: hypothetical protein ACR2PL_00415 [Dehalococcoidia bacterium]